MVACGFLCCLASCDLDSKTCLGAIECRLEIVPVAETVEVGDSIEFKFRLSTSDKVNIRIFDDPLCSLVFYLGSIRVSEKSERFCDSQLHDSQESKTSIATDYGVHNIVHRQGESTSITFEPNNPIILVLPANVGSDLDGNFMLQFSDDVYVVFRGPGDIGFAFRPDSASIIQSEVGRFVADHRVVLTPTLTDERKYLQIGTTMPR